MVTAAAASQSFNPTLVNFCRVLFKCMWAIFLYAVVLKIKRVQKLVLAIDERRSHFFAVDLKIYIQRDGQSGAMDSNNK